MSELKDTLNLPQTMLAMRANAAVREVEIEKFWEDNKIYEEMVSGKNKANKFILHDGPPYLSSDKIHIGTALNKILKDIVVKYKTQKGFYAPYVPGYDAHGLPIENAVVKNIKGGKDAISPWELRQKCREFALKNLGGQEENFKRLGVLGDWAHPYLTIAPDYEAEQIRIFGKMYEKGYIQKGKKAVYWCASCETALAEAEVEYMDHTSSAIYVSFEFVDTKKVYEKFGVISDASRTGASAATGQAVAEKPLYAVIWTTTPWTIPSNMAITLHAAFEYTLFKYNGVGYIVATELLENFIQEMGWENIEKLGTAMGAELEGLKTKHPLYDRFSPIILGEHVTLDAGTGAVHTAPGHGIEDWEMGQKYGLDIFSPFNNRGEWTGEVPDLEGVKYFKGNAIVIEKLEAAGALLAKSTIVHSYPHCWRCKNPVMYRATPQWFVKVGDFKDQTLEAIKNVEWIPVSGKKRISNMVENRSDWCISRQRAWGVPIPVFYCETCDETLINPQTIENVSKIFERESSDAWVKYEAKDLLPQGAKCPKCGGTHFKKETDIMDVWFDSGVSWAAVVNKRQDELGMAPVEMYLEGSDQHRGWFQSSLLTSVATTGAAPYKSVLTHGFVLDGEGRKMSKSLGNVVVPQEIIKLYGADVLRLWAASVDYRNDIKIGENIINQLVEIFKKTRNTMRFLLGNLFDYNPATDVVDYEKLSNIDKFALHKLNILIKNVDEAFENYEFYKYFQYLQNFAAVDLSSFYLDIVKDRLYTSGKKSLSRRACQTVLYEILWTLLKILVPVMPHQADDIFLHLPENQREGLKSVLLASWIEVKPEWKNEELESAFETLLNVREKVSLAIEPWRSGEEKIIRSSLEAGVVIVPNPEYFSFFKEWESELKDLFITSSAMIAESPPVTFLSCVEDGIDYKVFIQKAAGEKCERCWKYRKLDATGICEDCKKAIGENNGYSD